MCKLCDFGTARFNTQANNDTLLTLRGTYEYVAPEVLGKTAYVSASDIYSFGIILYELMTRTISGKYSGPYESLRMPSVAILVRVTRGTRPPIPPVCPPEVKALIERCWDAKPEVRPSSSELIAALTILSEQDISPSV
ncbi:MAG: protein kinase [archaeon]|nr:protein kinase [archaeon]